MFSNVEGCFADAQYNLGECNEYENGVDKDINEAVKWYRRVAKQGYKEIMGYLEIILNDDTEEEYNRYLTFKRTD